MNEKNDYHMGIFVDNHYKHLSNSSQLIRDCQQKIGCSVSTVCREI